MSVLYRTLPAIGPYRPVRERVHGACFNKPDGPSDRAVDHCPILFVCNRMVAYPGAYVILLCSRSLNTNFFLILFLYASTESIGYI